MCWICLAIGVSMVLRQKSYQLESKKYTGEGSRKGSSVVEKEKGEKINVNLLQF